MPNKYCLKKYNSRFNRGNYFLIYIIWRYEVDFVFSFGLWNQLRNYFPRKGALLLISFFLQIRKHNDQNFLQLVNYFLWCQHKISFRCCFVYSLFRYSCVKFTMLYVCVCVREKFKESIVQNNPLYVVASFMIKVNTS